MKLEFDILKKDPNSRARRGVLKTNHCDIETPVFCPVGTQATVKSLSAPEIKAEGAQVILNNAFHLYLRPGLDVIKAFNGTHNFQSWDRAIITDSGGFQIFSLSGLSKLTEEGAKFQSPYDGAYHFISPERAIEIQLILGSDIMMSFDECLQYPVNYSDTKKSLELTLRWAQRGRDFWSEYLDANNGRGGALYGVVQGGFFNDLRKECIERMIPMDFPGFALGGMSVGEPKNLLFEMTDFINEYLPEEKPRHLLGVGTPLDILRGVELGCDTFDCVMPTRNARNGSVFTYKGKVSVKAGAYKDDPEPIDPDCTCFTCQNFSKGYIRHLFKTGELLAPRLATIHSIHFYLDFMTQLRKSLDEDRFTEFAQDFRNNFSEETLTPGKKYVTS